MASLSTWNKKHSSKPVVHLRTHWRKNYDIAILNIKSSDYCCILSLISKNEAINLMQNANLTEKSKTL